MRKPKLITTVQMLIQKRGTRLGYTEFALTTTCIPAAVVEEMDLRKGETLKWEVVDDHTILVQVKNRMQDDKRQEQLMGRREVKELQRQELLAGGWKPRPWIEKDPADKPDRARHIPMDSGGGGWEDKD